MPEKKVKGLTMTVTFNQNDVLEMMKKLVERGKFAPVVHAHWEPIPGTCGARRCSACKEHAPYRFESAYSPDVEEYYSVFCPGCGAQMDEVIK